MASVYIAQDDFAVGDLAVNRGKIAAAAGRARRAGAEVFLTPELALSGYPPEDMLYDPSFLDAIEREFAALILQCPPSLAAVVGLPWRENGALYNGAALIRDGKLAAVYQKKALPNYSVFDECRYFSAHPNPPLLFEAAGETFAVQICHDLWSVAQAQAVKKSGAHCTLSLNASPFYVGKHGERLSAVAEYCRVSGTRTFYCNTVGGQDDLIFDGASFVMDADGAVRAQYPAFAAAEGGGEPSAAYPDDCAALYEALVMGVRDYADKTGFAEVALGLSGGVDSALVAAIAADALGAQKVHAVMMPSQHTSAASMQDAESIAAALGIEYRRMDIESLRAAFAVVLAPHLRRREEKSNVMAENLQARIRGVLLMALSNHYHWLLLATGNKSEVACGYATLYGDMCGGFAPIKDLSKTRVWEMARFRNRKKPVIPPRVIERPPSAELRDNQTDQDTLPPYRDIDEALVAVMHRRLSGDELARRFDGDFLAKFFALLAGGEHKRKQAAMGPKLTPCAFGRDWRMPVANYWRRG